MSELQRTCNTLEAGRVVRYHAVPTVGTQTVGLHSWGVAIILLYLTEGNVRAELLQAAILHDAPEIHTGDIPFTVKRDSATIKKALQELEDEAHRNVVLPFPQLQPSEEALLKVADTLEGLLWCRKTEFTGPVHGRWVSSLERALEKFKDRLSPTILARAHVLAYHPDIVCGT